MTSGSVTKSQIENTVRSLQQSIRAVSALRMLWSGMLSYKNTLWYLDYKHGAGIAVEVENNPQLLDYGLGALLADVHPAKRVKLVIVQPRCDHADGPVRDWEIDAIDLLDFRADLKAYAEATQRADAVLVSGDHCKFCAAAPLCPALEKKAQAVAKLGLSGALLRSREVAAALDMLDAVEPAPKLSASSPIKRRWRVAPRLATSWWRNGLSGSGAMKQRWRPA